LLPAAFSDRGVNPGDLAAMLQFIFTLESLALSLGCERSQLVIAVKQSAAGATDFAKLALLWSAECVLQLRDLTSLRGFFDHLLDNELTLPSLPEYLGGFLLSLAFTPLVSGLTVELMSKAFERLPDRVLMPWLPKLIMMLRPHAGAALPTLMKEAAAVYPGTLQALETWQPPWQSPPAAESQPSPGEGIVEVSQSDRKAQALLRRFPETTNAIASSLGVSPSWRSATPRPPAIAGDDEVAKLLAHHPATLQAVTSGRATSI
jgi:hypothetical protein